jgi:hypothetical protein
MDAGRHGRALWRAGMCSSTMPARPAAPKPLLCMKPRQRSSTASLNVNLRAVIRLSAAVLPPMLERRRGVILKHCIGCRPGVISSPRRLLHQQSRCHPGHARHCRRLRPFGNTLCCFVPRDDRDPNDPLAAQPTQVARRSASPHSATNNRRGVRYRRRSCLFRKRRGALLQWRRHCNRWRLLGHLTCHLHHCFARIKC